MDIPVELKEWVKKGIKDLGPAEDPEFATIGVLLKVLGDGLLEDGDE